jgi:hypothetical protein
MKKYLQMFALGAALAGPALYPMDALAKRGEQQETEQTIESRNLKKDLRNLTDRIEEESRTAINAETFDDYFEAESLLAFYRIIQGERNGQDFLEDIYLGGLALAWTNKETIEAQLGSGEIRVAGWVDPEKKCESTLAFKQIIHSTYGWDRALETSPRMGQVEQTLSRCSR